MFGQSIPLCPDHFCRAHVESGRDKFAGNGNRQATILEGHQCSEHRSPAGIARGMEGLNHVVNTESIGGAIKVF